MSDETLCAFRKSVEGMVQPVSLIVDRKQSFFCNLILLLS